MNFHIESIFRRFKPKVKELLVVSRTPIQSPHEVMLAEDEYCLHLAVIIKRCLIPRFYSPPRDLVMLPKGNNHPETEEEAELSLLEDRVSMYYCMPKPGSDGKEASFWLDRRYWVRALLEFQDFVRTINNDPDLKLEIVDHVYDPNPEMQAILINACSGDSIGEHTINLKPDGRVFIVGEGIGYYDLGFLTRRAAEEEAKALLAMLSRVNNPG